MSIELKNKPEMFLDFSTIDQLWAEEAESRIDAYERGEISAIPASEVFAKVGKEIPTL